MVLQSKGQSPPGCGELRAVRQTSAVQMWMYFLVLLEAFVQGSQFNHGDRRERKQALIDPRNTNKSLGPVLVG